MRTCYIGSKIDIEGVIFMGIDDIISHAKSGTPKDGLWVGVDSKLYPCFDSSDYLYENRRYMNFVFAESEEELREKLAKLEDIKPLGGAYFKLTKELHPMAYWQGEDKYDVIVTDDNDEGKYMPPDYRLPVVDKANDYDINRVFLDGIEKDALMKCSHHLVEMAKETLKGIPNKGKITPYRLIIDNDPSIFIVNCKFVLEVCQYEDALEGYDPNFCDYRILKTTAVSSTTGLSSSTTLCIASNNEGVSDFLDHFFIDYEICESLWKNYISIYTDMKMIF